MTVGMETLMPETPPELPEAELSVAPIEDKEPQARAEGGKFRGKEKEPEAKQLEQKTSKRPQQTVPLAVLLEERKARKQRDAEFERLRAELEALKNPPNAADPEPKFEEDPNGHTFTRSRLRSIC